MVNAQPNPSFERARVQVRDALLSAPAYKQLPADQRRQIARDLVEVVAKLEAPAADSTPMAGARLLDDLSSPAQYLSKQPQISGQEAKAAGAVASEDLKSVHFPDFIASLIQGVFQAIVNSSIEQMKAFTHFLESVTRSTESFESSISDRDAMNWANNQFPGANFTFSGGMGGMEGGLMVGDSSKVNLASLGLSGLDVESQVAQQKLLETARFRLARQKQRMLATLVLLGINRIVVTDGKINAKVRIQVSSKVSSQQQKEEVVNGEITGEREVTVHKEHTNFWGTSSSTSYTQNVPIEIGTEHAAEQDLSKESLDAKVALTGAVQINFRSDALPLERLAPPEQMPLIHQAADPANAGPVGGREAPSMSSAGGAEKGSAPAGEGR